MIEIVERAWVQFSDDPEETMLGLFHGTTLNKVRYALYKTLRNVELVDSFNEIFSYKFRRARAWDRVTIPRAPILDALTEKQREILFNANGNNTARPSCRDYYYSDSNCADCNELVAKKLMQKGSEENGRARFTLTSAGKLAATSAAVVYRHEAEKLIGTLTGSVTEYYELVGENNGK